MHHLVSDAGRMMYSIRVAKLDVWIGCSRALCDPTERLLLFLLVATTTGRILL